MASETITGNFSCDNSYALYLGNQSAVTSKILPTGTANGITRANAVQIFTGDTTSFVANTGDWFYLIAWSDDSAVQGLIGEFSGTNNTIFTGNAAWEVYATGKNYGNNQAPTMVEINGHITTANNGNLWVPTAIGPINSQSNQIYNSSNPNLKVGNVSDDANWIWHDSGRNPGQTAFAGFNHDEFLIFRIPTWIIEPELDPNPEPTPEPSPEPSPAPTHQDCCCGGSAAPTILCAAPEKKDQFDVFISRVRITKNSARDGKAEIMLTGYANGTSALVPGMGSYLTLFTNWGWRVLNKFVTTVETASNTINYVPIMAEAIQTMTSGMQMGASQEIKYLKLSAGTQMSTQILTVECFDARNNNNSSDRVLVLEIEFVAFQK